MIGKLFEDVDYYYKKFTEELEYLRNSIDDLILENNDLKSEISDLEEKIDGLYSELAEYEKD